jgi:hypothetical protein
MRLAGVLIFPREGKHIARTTNHAFRPGERDSSSVSSARPRVSRFYRNHCIRATCVELSIILSMVSRSSARRFAISASRANSISSRTADEHVSKKFVGRTKSLLDCLAIAERFRAASCLGVCRCANSDTPRFDYGNVLLSTVGRQ